jgi:hypothetical protein
MFRELAEGARRALEDLPDVLRQMEVQTFETRTWISELEASAAGGGDARTLGRAEARDAAQHHLAETVTALETLRLELLRFHEGSGTLDGLTAELGAAREITRAVDLLLAGRREVREVLDQWVGVSTG